MKIALIGAAALALMLPHAALAATDGQPGATSTGSFNVSLNVQPPSQVTVHLLGLDDFDFGTIQTSPTASTVVPSIKHFLCMKRSDPGILLFTLTQNGLATYDRFRLNSPSGAMIPLTITRRYIDGESFEVVTNNAPSGTGANSANCTAASGTGVADSLEIKPDNLPPNATSGVYSAIITVTLSLQ
jgi:hypothetical protein